MPDDPKSTEVFPSELSCHLEVLIAEALPEPESQALVQIKQPRVLSAQEIRRLGALQIEDIQDASLESFLDQQRQTYLECGKDLLIDTLLDRDRQLALEGRALVEGKIGARLLREFVRGVLAAADRQDMSRADRLEGILQALGAEPADRRQLKRFGTTLGDGASEAERLQLVEDLSSGAIKE
jgi:hypothetical protein